MSLEKVYRRLSPEERAQIDVHGRCSLVALSPDSTTSLVSHIVDGSSASKFIATCKTIPALQKWMELELETPSLQEKVVEIDVARLRQDEQIEVLDLTDTHTCIKDDSFPPEEVDRAKQLADEFEEVFIVGEIPSQYVQEIPLVQIRPSGINFDKAYRRLRPEEKPYLGLTAKNDNSGRSVLDHIKNGSTHASLYGTSRYISSCRTESAMLQWRNIQRGRRWRGQAVRIVEIDIKTLLAEQKDVRVINLSDPEVRTEYIPLNESKATHRVNRFAEVLFIGKIPPRYLKDVSERF